MSVTAQDPEACLLSSDSPTPTPRAWTLTRPFSPSDIYVFGVGPLVNQENINALASKKDKEQHVFKLKDVDNLEDVFFQMLGRKLSGGYKETVRSLSSPQAPHTLPLLPKLWPSRRPLSTSVIILASWHCPHPALRTTEL